MGTPSEVIIEKIMKKFSLTEKKAREFVGQRGQVPVSQNLIKYNTCEILLDLIRHFPADIQGSMLENPLTYQDN